MARLAWQGYFRPPGGCLRIEDQIEGRIVLARVTPGSGIEDLEFEVKKEDSLGHPSWQGTFEEGHRQAMIRAALSRLAEFLDKSIY